MKTPSNSILDLIGNTPLVELKDYAEAHQLKGKIFVKLDGFNPFGSSKDRVALQMIKDAIRSGKLQQGGTIIEPTSGNTGIGLAAIAGIMGYKMIILMPANMSVERIKMMKAYGAEVILTDAKKGMKGSIAEAKKLAKTIPNSFLPMQFNNKSNPKAHLTTGKEIYHDLPTVDAFIAGIGTGGTISGVGRYLKKKNPNIRIIGFEPDSSPFITRGYAQPHKIQGIGAGFIPKILDMKVVDEILTVTDSEALDKMIELSSRYALFVGVSSAAAIALATKLAKLNEYEGKNIVAFSPDNGNKYLSLSIFD